MGYVTTYNLQYEILSNDEKDDALRFIEQTEANGPAIPEDIKQRILNVPSLYENVDNILKENKWDDIFSTKWYDHEEEMRGLSLKFPTVLFTLRGHGEEAGDIWVKYFLNGKMQVERAQITLGEFDMEKLR